MIRPLALSIAFLAVPAWADEFRVYQEEPGGGVNERLSGVDRDAAAVLLGEPAPEGATGIVVEVDGDIRWTNLTRREVNGRYGGDGDPTIVPFPEEDAVVAEAGSEAIELRGGTWRAVLLTNDATGCPAGVTEKVAAQFSTSGDMTLPAGPFRPPNADDMLAWRQVAPNEWRGEFRQDGGGFGVRVDWEIIVESPVRVTNLQTFAIAGPIFGDCRAVTRTAWEHAG